MYDSTLTLDSGSHTMRDDVSMIMYIQTNDPWKLYNILYSAKYRNYECSVHTTVIVIKIIFNCLAKLTNIASDKLYIHNLLTTGVVILCYTIANQFESLRINLNVVIVKKRKR